MPRNPYVDLATGVAEALLEFAHRLEREPVAPPPFALTYALMTDIGRGVAGGAQKLGRRQRQILALLERSGTDGLPISVISERIDYGRGNVHVALRTLESMGKVELLGEARPQHWRVRRPD